MRQKTNPVTQDPPSEVRILERVGLPRGQKGSLTPNHDWSKGRGIQLCSRILEHWQWGSVRELEEPRFLVAKSFQQSKQSILCGGDSVTAASPELSSVKNCCLSKCRSCSSLCLTENTA